MFLSLPAHHSYNWLLTSVICTQQPDCQCLRLLAWLALALPNVGRCPLCCSWPSPEDRRDLVSWQVAMLILFSKIWVDSSLEPVGGVTLRVQPGLCGRCVKVHNTVKTVIQAAQKVCYNLVFRTRCSNTNLNTIEEKIFTPTVRNSQEQVCKLSCWLL